MVEVSLIKLPGVYTILSCNRTVVADPSAISRGSVGERSATDWWSVGDCILGVCFWLQKLCNFLEIGRQPIDDQSATKNCVQIVCNRYNWTAISRQPVGDQSPTCWRPPKTFLQSIWSQRGFSCSNKNLLATKSSMQQPATGRPPVASYVWLGLYLSKYYSSPNHRSSVSRGFGFQLVRILLINMLFTS